MLNNKKAQIAETMTWVVATIIIIVILTIAIYAASIMSLVTHTINVDSEGPSVLLKKSLQGFLLTQEITDEKKESVFTKLESKGEFDDFTNLLKTKVFTNPYDQSTYILRISSLIVSKFFDNGIRINDENVLVVIK